MGVPRPSGDSHEDASPDVALSFVIQGGSERAQALAITRAAISRLRGDIEILSDSAPPPSADRWVVFLRAGDIPCERFPHELAQITCFGIAEVVSFDLFHCKSGRVFPVLLPGANPSLLRATDYLFDRVALRSWLISPEVDRSRVRAHELVLAWLKGTSTLQARGRWRHVGQPILQAAIDVGDVEKRREVALASGRTPSALPCEAASIVVCTRDKGHLTRQLVRGLLARPADEVAEVVIVSNGTTNPYALATLENLSQDPRVKILRRDTPFNFSRLCNEGARATGAAGPLLFLNDDIAPVSEDWLRRLLARLGEPDVAAVGPLLLYPDERVQHAGMYLGFQGIAGHVLRGAQLPQEDYLFTAVAPREVSCLTGAVLLVRREAFEALNGFDEQLGTYLQDVDLGLRLRRSGWINLFEPASVLIHMESTSIRTLRTSSGFSRQRDAEYRRFVERWGSALVNDPLHPSGFDIQDESLHRLAGAGGFRPEMFRDADV
ncbi:glycosyltransferase [Caulobacter sp. S45]|uniref:glycosyltransferase n=1 Tax=Caulobacter sp. S45 TaxID=1641861 RepID=UPI001C20453C|nr:glycosyltransferase [Caulobacter sp. S45]